MALPHSHTLLSPYIEWKEKDKKTGEVIERRGINSRNFSSKTRIIQLNNIIDAMCREKFGCPYMTGEGKHGKGIEQIKADSKLEETKKANDDFVRSLTPTQTKTIKNFIGGEKEVPKTEDELQHDREVLAAQEILKR